MGATAPLKQGWVAPQRPDYDAELDDIFSTVIPGRELFTSGRKYWSEGRYGMLMLASVDLLPGVGATRRTLAQGGRRIVRYLNRFVGQGDTVLGHIPGYTEKARRRGANYLYKTKDEWDAIGDRAAQWDFNRDWLDEVADRGDRILLSVLKNDIRPGSFLEQEIQHLTQNRGYVWVNQWSLRPGAQ